MIMQSPPNVYTGKLAARSRGEYYTKSGGNLEGMKDSEYGFMSDRPETPDFSQWKHKSTFSHQNMRGRRRKRHIGPHDIDGIQRLISTGWFILHFIKCQFRV
jgi:hypothetical protein